MRTLLVFVTLSIFIMKPITAQISNTIDQKIEKLLSQMTLKEKLGQMSQFSYSKDTISSTLREKLINGEIGSFLNVENITLKDELQKIVISESRLKIPLIYGRDVIHGFRTLFPIPIGQSCSWNIDLIERASYIAAKEAAAEGYKWTFAPMIDITRNPRWGRIAETCGEDTYLSSLIGAAMIRGFQGNDMKKNDRIAACAKHFVGYGATEDGRDYNTTYIPEQALRETYLPPFKAAVDAGVATFMSAFNDLNGIPTSGNVFTLRNILREEWKYSGMVVSDWTAVTEMITHGYCSNEKEAAYRALKAGVEMEMVSTSFISYAEELIKEGRISMNDIDNAVRNILKLKYNCGLFESPYTDSTYRKEIFSTEHKNVALELTLESTVLLKNKNQTLPLNHSTINKIALIGPLANDPFAQRGTWSFDAHDKDMITPLMSFKDFFGEKLNYVQGLKNSRDNSHDQFEKAIDAAKNSDIVVFIGGEESILSGESRSRAFLDLPGAQNDLISELKKANKPIILIIMAGRPLTFEKQSEIADAVIYQYHPGVMGGPSLLKIVTGEFNPCGRLTNSFPRTVGQVPIYYNRKNTGRPAPAKALGIPTGDPINPIGYTSYFLDVANSPAYSFGYGIGFSTFEYSEIKIDKTTLHNNDSVIVSINIKNIGKFKGIETAQLYIRDLHGSITRPIKELKGFQRVSLNPGETKRVQFAIHESLLRFWTENMLFESENGNFHAWISPYAEENLNKVEFELEK